MSGLPTDRSSSDSRTREFLELLTQHEPRLQAFIFASVQNWADALDIAQETRLRLWDAFDLYDPTKDFGTWSRTIAYYQILTHREKAGRNRELPSSEFVNKLAEHVDSTPNDSHARRRAVDHCFEQLEADKQELLMGWYSGNCPVRQVAERSGRSYEAARKLIFRVRKVLAECVDRQLGRGNG